MKIRAEPVVTPTRTAAGEREADLAGGWPGDSPPTATSRVSLPDPDARPIAKGRLGKPVEFGSKPAQVGDNDDDIVLDRDINPVTPPTHPGGTVDPTSTYAAPTVVLVGRWSAK